MALTNSGRTPGPAGTFRDLEADIMFSHPEAHPRLPGPSGTGARGPLFLGEGSGSAQPSGYSSKADAVANLTKPSSSAVQQLSAAITTVLKLNKNKTKDEALRLKKEKVVHDIVKAYGVGLTHVTGLEFSNRNDSSNHAETLGTFIIVFDSVLVHPGFVASVILHESSHAQRNAELDNAGVRLSFATEDIWSALKEFEGAQLEIDSAAKTGITEKEKKEATSLRNSHLSEIEALMGKKTRTEIENGGLDAVRARFIQQLKSRP